MRFKLDISCDNEAFVPDPNPEVARILRELADELTDGSPAVRRNVLDANGNRVGAYRWEN